jgi:hypothetical protein
VSYRIADIRVPASSATGQLRSVWEASVYCDFGAPHNRIGGSLGRCDANIADMVESTSRDEIGVDGAQQS